jgi:hypothetical protein
MGSKSSTAPGCLTPQVRWEVTHGHWPGKIVVGLTPAKCQTRASERERQLILSHQWFLFHPFFFLKIWHQGNSAIACRSITRNRASNRPGQKTILLNADREALETYNYSTPQGLPPRKSQEPPAMADVPVRLYHSRRADHDADLTWREEEE